MNNIKADLLIIGAGSGGLVLASGAAQLGANVGVGRRGTKWVVIVLIMGVCHLRLC
jgi:pyruvate/2-oxoglutarate dehydrogenase complex dihydrolipoamide dehydrogenase (E3) component